jgi:hypothetical protein
MGEKLLKNPMKKKVFHNTLHDQVQKLGSPKNKRFEQT